MPSQLSEKTPKLLARLQMSFERFSSGGFMNQSQFGAFCLEMGMANPEMARRIFAAMDGDECGALEPHEFVLGLRLMCDYSYRPTESRVQFAFHLLDEDRGGLVEADEAEDFVLSFERAAVATVQGWARSLEGMFGSQIGGRGAGGEGQQQDGGAATQFGAGTDPALVKATTKDALEFCEDFVCVTHLGEDIRDADVPALFKAKYEADQAQNPDAQAFQPAKHFVLRADDGSSKALATFKHAFKTNGQRQPQEQEQNKKMVAQAAKAMDGFEYRSSTLGAEVSRGIDQASFQRWCEESGSGRLNLIPWLRRLGDRWVHTMGQPLTERQVAILPPAPEQPGQQLVLPAVIDGAKERELRELYGHYATENLLDRRGFTRCMRRLGLCHPLLLERFFSLFDQNDMHFLDEDTFVAALRRICDADANQKDSLVFDLMDEDSSGFLTMTEFRSFLTEFFAAASDTFVRKPGAEALGHAPTILDSLCTLIPTAAAEDFAESIESKLQAQITQYIDNVVQTAFGGIASSAYGWAGAGEEERELRMYFADFQAWSQGACAAWLSRQVQVWLDAVSLAKQVAQEEPTDLQLKELRAAVKNPKKAGALAKKAKAQVQPSRGSGAPKIPRPSCKFPREQVKMFQDLFYQISSDGIMRPDEWKRCMSRLGVANGYTQERLFLMFDTDGDKEMNAKEFTCGLSDICLGSDAERVAFAYRFYDVTGEGMLSRNEFQLLLSKIKGQCDLSVKKASRELFKVYGIDVVQMEHTDDALERERRTAMLSTEIDEELKLYCYDVWDEFAKGKPQMDYKAFTVLAEKAPSLVDWLTELGKNIQRRFPRLLGMTFEEVVVPDSLPEEGNISLSAQKMMESFDQFAYPRRIEGGDRVLLTVRTTVKMKVDGQPDTPQPPTAHIASCFAAALPLSEFAKTGLNGQVEVSKGATRAEPFFDTTLVVELPAAALSARIDQFLEACATQLGLPALHLWINGPIGDGGPEAAIVQLRSLGAPTVLKTRFTLQLSSGVDLPAENLKVYVGDKANVVFRLQWRATDVLKKVDGTNGMRKALSNATGSDSQDLDIQVDPLDDGTCRITASMRMCEAGRHAAEEGLRSNFGRICARLGLAASPEEEIFCDYTLVLSNIRTSHFHAAAQSVFREVLGAAVGLDVSNVTIVENSWTSDTQTTVVLRLFFGKEGSSVDKLRLEMIFKLQNALVDSILTDALRKKLASSRLRIQDPVEVSHGSHADAVFSLKSDFVAVLKQDNVWQQFCEGFKQEYGTQYVRIVSGNAHAVYMEDDDEIELEVIPGMMNMYQFEKCLESLGVGNGTFARQLFRLFDEDQSGSIELSEFVETFRQLSEPGFCTDDRKERMLFKLHDLDGKNIVSARSIAKIFRSFYRTAEDQLVALASDVNRIVTGLPASFFPPDRYKVRNKAAVRKQCDTVEEDCDYSDVGDHENVAELGKGDRVKVLESRTVGMQTRVRFAKDRWTSIKSRTGDNLLVPRWQVSGFASAIQKQCVNQMDWVIDAMVADAMAYAIQTPGQLQRREFCMWAQNNSVVQSYLESIAAPWMVVNASPNLHRGKKDVATDSRIQNNLVKRRLQERADKARAALTHVLTEADIGKKLDDVVREAEDPAVAAAPTSTTISAVAGVRWSRAFAIIHRSESVQRHQIRPKTQFDNVNQADVEFLFTRGLRPKSVPESLDYGMFTTLLKKIGFNNGRVVRHTFDMMRSCRDPTANESSLARAEAACGMLLLVQGPFTGRLQKSFSFLEQGGRLTTSALRRLLGVYQGVALYVVADVVARNLEVLGPQPITKGERNNAAAFQKSIQTLATERLHRAGEHLLAQARARSVAEEDGEIAFTRDEWCTWLLESPRLRQWLSRLGNAAVEALSALEDCYLPLLPEGRGELPESTYRLWRKFPLGTHFDHITPEHVRQVFEANASDGQLRLEQFSLCLNQMQIYSTFSIRRLFQLFDHDESGTVELHEFASSFLLLCGGSLEEKLQKAFAMYDADASGYLGRSELNSMLTAFARVGLDAVGCSLSIVASILGEDATVENEVNRRGRAQVERYAAALQASAEQFCYRDAVHLYYSEFIRWARQDRDFLHWLSALRNAWIESLLEYEDRNRVPTSGELLRRPDPAQLPSRSLTPAPRAPAAMGATSAPASGGGGGGGSGSAVEASSPPGPPPLPSHQPAASTQSQLSELYGYPYMVTKTYPIQIRAPSSASSSSSSSSGSRLHGAKLKRLSYSNAATREALRLTLHTDRPDLLDFGTPAEPRSLYVIPGGHDVALQLMFLMPVVDGHSSSQAAAHPHRELRCVIRLFLHNEVADRCEECLEFHMRYVLGPVELRRGGTEEAAGPAATDGQAS